MPFVGIFAKESDANFIKKEVLKNSINNKFEIININKKSVENIKNIRFETVVINDDLTEFLKNSNYIEEIIRNSKFLIINTDIVKNLDVLLNNKISLVTYGLNQKAMVTMSSIKKENILICVQNKFENSTGQMIEEQEVNVEISKNNLKKICNSMAVFSILIIYGEKLQKI